MSQCLATQSNDNIISVQTLEFMRVKKALRGKSANPSATYRLYNDEGICYYCVTCHESFHGHSYIVEYDLKGDRLLMTISSQEGDAAPVVTMADSTRWKMSQRKDLIENTI